ncbi:MAG: rhodanese-like domain-containing protein [Candidatus Staskawiczbacteria bacterium]|nr:rhodanese-like domain-containing protein [Candidatus Staskawiczbacteria bacterium]
MKKEDYTIILFYKFVNIKDQESFKIKQKRIAKSFNLKGRMLIAKEGVNATFEGTTKNIKAYIKKLKSQNNVFSGKSEPSSSWKKVVFKESKGDGKAFTKLKIKVRPEIVTLGIGNLDIKKETAPVVSASQLDIMYEKKEDFLVLDLRNDFEIKAGYFKNTINPKLRNFRDLPNKIKNIKHLKERKIVAVCTGGIRCEKATVLLKKEGFKNLYQLEDGIHAYIKKFPGKFFKGSLFVFDNRMLTPVVENSKREIVGRCRYCNKKSEVFYNDDSVRPSRKIICCSICIMQHKSSLRPAIPV